MLLCDRHCASRHCKRPVSTRTHLWRVCTPYEDEDAAILIVHRGRVTKAPEDLEWTQGHRFAMVHRYLKAHGCTFERLSA